MNNIFIKSIKIDKDIYSGDWYVDTVETNKGTFRLGTTTNGKVDQNQVSIFMDLLKKSVLPDLEMFLEEEIQQESNEG